MLFKMEAEKIVLLQLKGLIVKFKTENILCTFVSSTSHPLRRAEIIAIGH